MKHQYLTLLQLDSIYRLLTWDERIQVHLLMQNKTKDSNELIHVLLALIEEFSWYAPDMRYDQDRLLYYFEEELERWLPIEQYKNNNPELTKELLI
ncbi:hypothetical protein [Elizabethkingia anophelis]|uniref:hypothetical protein n=1 Tax=Elizabethkingia anophelis TaxID=1117645 RepID=UPI0012B223BF|nr:hypothetical protein [Elizabethkingia anophelis]MBE9391930.1 hypothetical protein [Elizabethkingia anophelis]MBE9405370.1 hypothetical protein [Elizabethkingia anophelis]QGN21586.1 hypothetical protein GJV56_02635 [Elizabethkingia anophelis]QNV08248.1 hypothetical protein EIY88_02635 [Elizabethkingia anophelis]UTF89989.1 hypothetical protein J2N93_02640 [Elizabethkingia anophelis]